MTSTPHTSPTDGRAARWAGQRDRRRREIVDAALRAIAQHGPQVSTAQIADQAGVARPQLYRHFTDTTDLQRSIADRAAELITRSLRPVWQPHGTPMQMITAAVDAHTGWLADHGNLYRYLTRHAHSGRDTGHDAVTDVKTVIARQITALFEYYMSLFAMDTRFAESAAFGLVGLVDSSTAQWLENPQGVTRGELAELLSGWVWRVLDDTLRTGDVRIDPHTPLSPAPESPLPGTG